MGFSKTQTRETLFPAGLEPASFRVWGGRDNHYTTETNRPHIEWHVQKTTYVAWLAKYCARPMPSTWSPWRNRPARLAVNRKVGGSSPPGNCYFCVLEISKQSQQVSTNREAENAGKDHIMQVSKATVAVILVMCLMHVYERRSCLTTKPHIQRLIAWTLTPVNSQSSVNGKNAHVTYVKDLRGLEIIFEERGLVVRGWTLM